MGMSGSGTQNTATDHATGVNTYGGRIARCVVTTSKKSILAPPVGLYFGRGASQAKHSDHGRHR
jgi:hypothetical protein